MLTSSEVFHFPVRAPHWHGVPDLQGVQMLGHLPSVWIARVYARLVHLWVIDKALINRC